MKNLYVFAFSFMSLITACGGVSFETDSASSGVGGPSTSSGQDGPSTSSGQDGETDEGDGPSTSSSSSFVTTSISSTSSSTGSTGVGGSGGEDTTSSATDSSSSSGSDPSTSSGQGGEGGGEPCMPQLLIEYMSHAEMTVVPGDIAVPTILVKFTAASCGNPMEISHIALMFSTPDAEEGDHTPYCVQPCDAPEYWNFVNPKLTRIDTNATVMGPTVFQDVAINQLANADLNDPFTMMDGETITFYFTIDIAKSLVTPISGMKYAATFLGVTGEFDFPVITNSLGTNKYITIQ